MTENGRYAEAFRLVDEGKARPQVVEMVELLRAGLGVQEAGRRLGIAKSTAYQRLTDPTDERNRARKRKQYGTCETCGGPTSYGVGGPHPRCIHCDQHRNDAENERIAEMWNDGTNGYEIAEELGLNYGVVTSRIETWRERGHPVSLHRLGGKADEREHRRGQIQKFVAEGRTNAEIAAELGYTTAESAAEAISKMRERGYELPRRDNGSLPLVPDEEVVDAYRRGVLLKDMAAMFGYANVSGVSLRLQWLRKKGYDLPYRKPR